MSSDCSSQLSGEGESPSNAENEEVGGQGIRLFLSQAVHDLSKPPSELVKVPWVACLDNAGAMAWALGMLVTLVGCWGMVLSGHDNALAAVGLLAFTGYWPKPPSLRRDLLDTPGGAA